jgi:hypothetical protein
MKTASKYAHLEVDFWQTQDPVETSNKVSFALLLKDVIESSAQSETTANRFKACGVCPLNLSALYYTKCL